MGKPLADQLSVVVSSFLSRPGLRSTYEVPRGAYVFYRSIFLGGLHPLAIGIRSTTLPRQARSINSPGV